MGKRYVISKDVYVLDCKAIANYVRYVLGARFSSEWHTNYFNHIGCGIVARY